MTRAAVEDRERKVPRHLCCDICEAEYATFRVQVTDMKGVVLDSCKVCGDCSEYPTLENAGGDSLCIVTPMKGDING